MAKHTRPEPPLTPTQAMVLQFIATFNATHDGLVSFVTARPNHTTSCEPSGLVRCQYTTPHLLQVRGYIQERHAGYNGFELTDKGRAAVARMQA